MADRTFYSAKGLIGGAADDLDLIDGAALLDGDMAYVTLANAIYFYMIDDDSAATELSPAIIQPDANGGNKRWILQNIFHTGIYKNLIINGGMEHAQRGASGTANFTGATTPLNSDDTYLLDRFILLSDGNDIVDVTQQSGGGVSGNETYVRLDVETAAKKFGLLQIIENKNCKSIIGDTATLSFEAKVTNATKLSDIRAVVLSWDNGADVVTSDVVSAWSVEGTTPTSSANWNTENLAVNLGVTTSWARYKIEAIPIDAAGADNVAVFIYQNNVATNDTVGIFLEITNVQLESGVKATDFEYIDPAISLTQCQRRFSKSYNQDVAPGTADPDGTISASVSAVANADHVFFLTTTFPVTMADTPTITLYDGAGASAKVTMAAGDGIAGAADLIGHNGFRVTGTNGAVNTTRELLFHYLAEIEL